MKKILEILKLRDFKILAGSFFGILFILKFVPPIIMVLVWAVVLPLIYGKEPFGSSFDYINDDFAINIGFISAVLTLFIITLITSLLLKFVTMKFKLRVDKKVALAAFVIVSMIYFVTTLLLSPYIVDGFYLDLFSVFYYFSGFMYFSIDGLIFVIFPAIAVLVGYVLAFWKRK